MTDQQPDMMDTTPSSEGTESTTEVEMSDATNQTTDDAVLGIDFGSQTCVASLAIRGKGLPVLVPNNLSNLSTPNVVSFRPDERVIGEEGANRMISDAQSTVSLVKLIVGKRYSELAPELINSLPYKLLQGEGDSVLIKVNYGEGEKDGLFTPSHVAGMMLKEMANYAFKQQNLQAKKVVIAIPSSWGPVEKRAITDAATIAGLEVISLISENTAVALDYGYTHDLEEKEPAKKVAVVNLGHQFFGVQIVEYTKGKVRVLASTCATGIGGAEIDNRLVQHFAKEFKEKYKADALSNSKARARLQRACEKAKKVLSTIPETDLEMDCLMDDIFVKGRITRTTMEGLIQDLLGKMKELIAVALSEAGVKAEELVEIEIVGGGLRIPSVQQAISDAFGGKELLKNIDGSSAVAEGAAIYAAVSTPGFELSYQVEDAFLSIPPSAQSEGGLSEQQLQESIEREKKMDEKDRERAETGAAKNQLETSLYDWRDKVASDLFSQDVGDKKEDLLALFRDVEDWLYSDEGEEANKARIVEKLREVREKIEQISPKFHLKLVEIQQQKEKEIEEATKERERLASLPSVSSRDKTEKPLTKKEKFEAAKKRKNQGNLCFKDGDFEGAVSRYVSAVSLADEVYDSVTDEEKAELKELKVSSFLNLAMCCLKLNESTKAIDMCKKVLELDPNNVKALFRRAHALRNKKEFESAMKDLAKAQQIEPQNQDVSKAIIQVKKLLDEEKSREKKTYARMFS